MKKVAALAASLAIAGLGSSPAFAATQTGAVKFTWTIPVSFTAHIASDYKTGQASFATGTGTVQTSTSAGSGTCTTGATDAFNSYTLTFGTVTPGTGATGCNYQNALGISVNTNDANGYTIGEAIDLAAAPTNWGVCVFSDGATATATTPASTQGSAPAAGTFTAGALTALRRGRHAAPAGTRRDQQRGRRRRRRRRGRDLGDRSHHPDLDRCGRLAGERDQLLR